MNDFILRLTIPFVLAFLLPGSAGAQLAPAELQDLVGARSSGAEAQLQARGYARTRTDRHWSYWWNAQRYQCVAVATVDGRYASLTAAPDADCRRPEPTSPQTQSAPSDLRDLVGARAAGAETQLQVRGYAQVASETGADRKWGLWWNARQRQCVAVSTVDGRYQSIRSMTTDDCRRGAATSAQGQAAPAELRDLVGMRAAGGEAQLQARGFSHAGTEAGAERTWSYWWSGARRQCIAVVTVDGRYQSIRSTPEADCRPPDNAGKNRNTEPRVTIGTGGWGEAIFISNNCIVAYKPSGVRHGNSDECRPEQLLQADEAVALERRQ